MATSPPTTLISTTENMRDDDDYLMRSEIAETIAELRVKVPKFEHEEKRRS